MTRKPKGRGRKTIAVAKRKPVKRKPVKPDIVPLAALSVIEWCKSYRIGRNSFYKMLKEGTAPASIRIGRRRIITLEASMAWQRSQESVTEAAA